MIQLVKGAAQRHGMRRFGCALLASAAVLAPHAASAQDTVAEEVIVDEIAEGGDIVVTALRRDTRIQDTPLAISAVTGASLETAGTTSFTDLTRNAPSLRIVDSGPGQRRVIVRGVTAAGEPTVGVYYDEAPVSGSVSTSSDSSATTPDFRLFDVARAEVLRGPQGTLFGAGSMGGTLRIIFEKPKADRLEAAFSGNMTTVKSGKEGASVDAMINIPIVQDVLAIRAVGNYNQFAGYVDNIRLGLKDINDGNSYGGRLLARFTPNSDITLDLAANYEKVATDSSRWISETGVKYATNGRAESGNYDENKLFNGTLTWDFGPVAMTASTTYTDRKRINMGDVSDTFIGRDTPAGCTTYRKVGCANPAVYADYLADTRSLFSSVLWQPNKVTNWANEVRFSTTGSGPFQATAGVYMQDRDTTVRSTLLLADPVTGEIRDPDVAANIAYDRTINDTLKQKAAFAELSYTLFDKLTLTAGTRYYEYKKTVGGRIDLGQEHYSSVVTPYTEAKTKDNGFVYKFNISYQVNDDVMVYTQAAQGFRPGGVNQVIGLSAGLAAYDSDSLWNYEIGVKSEPFRRVYFNVAGYCIDWDDLQVSARTSGTGSVFGLIANAGAARIEGVEVELSAEPADGLMLSANGAFTDARLTEDQKSAVVTTTAKKGDRLAFVPRWNVGASAEYTAPMTDTLEGFGRLDFTYTSNSYSVVSSVDSYRRFVPSNRLVNARIGVQGPDGGWGAYLFVQNVFNATAINSRSSSANTGGLTTVYSAAPRTLGLNIIKRFK